MRENKCGTGHKGGTGINFNYNNKVVDPRVQANPKTNSQ